MRCAAVHFEHPASRRKLDETLYSRHVARELALENEEIEITGQRACELLPVSLWDFESPFWFGAVASPFLEMTRVARAQGYKVSMSGDGSDELLAGYDFYRLMVLNQTFNDGSWGGYSQPSGATRSDGWGYRTESTTTFFQ